MVSGFEFSTKGETITYIGKRFNDGIGGQLVHRFITKAELSIGDILSPVASQKLINHSPDGFNWGYSGSGPAQLALGLLLDVAHDPSEAMRYYQDFKFDVVSGFGAEWKITTTEILAWLMKRKSEVNNANSR